MKTTKETTEAYYQAMFKNQGWEELLSDQATYFDPLSKLIEGKEAVIGVTKQFLQGKHTGVIKSIISEGDMVCVRTHYQVGHPDVALLEVDACEIIKVVNGKIASMEVYFDSKSVSEFGAKMQQLQEQK